MKAPPDPCPCGGERSATWHRARGWRNCPGVQAAKAAAQRLWKAKHRPDSGRWVPGSPILVEEIEQL